MQVMKRLFEKGEERILVGQTVLQVLFAQDRVDISFYTYPVPKEGTGYSLITIKSSYALFSSESVEEKRIIDVCKPIEKSALMKTLECRVTEVHLDPKETLSITFNNGSVLECYKSSLGESYILKQGERSVTV